MKTILEGLCPEDQHHIRHTGIKRECPCCHLIVYGNPQFIAYNPATKKKAAPLDVRDGCPECQERESFFDKKHYERICVSCGLVLEGPPQSGVTHPFGNTYDYSQVDKTWEPYD